MNATEITKLAPTFGMIDDAIATDGARLAYVVTDTAQRVELHVRDLATHQEQVIELAPVTRHPLELELLGQRAFVIGKSADGRQVAALVELQAKGKKPAGTAVYQLGPADGISLITRDGKRRIAVHTATVDGAITRHEVSLFALETGRRVAKGRAFELDGEATNAKLDLRVNHWSDGWSRAHGIKAGEWSPKENMRMPDVEATFDLVTGKLAKQPITDLFDQRRRFQALAGYAGPLDFVRMAQANAAVERWRGGRPSALELDEPTATYDPASLQSVLLSDGSAWLALKVDPVNPAAVARRKADPEYLDVFHVSADGKGVRTARVLAKGVRHAFGVIAAPQGGAKKGAGAASTGTRFWLLEKNKGGGRGGTSLTLYQLP